MKAERNLSIVFATASTIYFYECAGGGTFGTVQFSCDRDPSEIVHGTIQKQMRWAPSNLLTNY